MTTLDPSTGSIIIAAVQIVFGLALLPTVCDRRAQVPRPSSAITALGLWVIAAVYLLMGLTSASMSATLAAALWSFVFFFRPVRA